MKEQNLLQRTFLSLERKLLESFGAEFLSPQEIEEGIRALANQVSSSKFDPQLVVGIKRGGTYLAERIGELIDRPVEIMDVSRQRREIFGIDSGSFLFASRVFGYVNEIPKIRSLPNVDKDVKRVLIVDEDTSSGKTLGLAIEHFTSKGIDSRSTVFFKNGHNGKADFSLGYNPRAGKYVSLKFRFPWSPLSPYFSRYSSYM